MKKHTILLFCTFALTHQVLAAEYLAQNNAPTKKNKQKNTGNTIKQTTRYPVNIRTDNKDIEATLKKYLPLITRQQEEELDREQIILLAEETPKDIQTILKSKGYFNSKVIIIPSNNGYTIDITPGPRTKVSNVNIVLAGDIQHDPDLAQYYQNAMLNWTLSVGEHFDQEQWGNSKNAVLSALVRKKYPLAKFTQTKAKVNPKTNTVDLSVTIESGQPIYFGDIHISNTKRYPKSIVLNLARFKPDTPYDLNQLLDYQQALEQDSHYAGALVQADFDNMQGNRVPIKVSVKEIERHQFTASINYDLEYGFGSRFSYSDYNLFNHGYIGSLVTNINRYETMLLIDVNQPRKKNGRYLTGNLSYTQSITQKLEKQSINSGIWYVYSHPDTESRIGIEYLTENHRVPNAPYTSSYATMLTAAWKRQKIRTGLRPENGYYFDGKIGITPGSLLSSTAIFYTHANAGYYFTPENKKIGTFAIRGEAGYTFSKNTEKTPATLQFRTGGVTSVRGYKLNSIGLEGPNGSVLPAHTLAVASFEYQYPLTRNFSAALFHDMGDVAQSFTQISLKHSTGVGVRWFSPIAPISFDIAYNRQDKKLDWHLNLSTRF